MGVHTKNGKKQTIKGKLKALHPTYIFNQFKNIRNKIFSLTFLLLFIFGVMSVLVFQFLNIMYEEKLYEESAETLRLSSHVLDEELQKVEELSFQFTTELFIQDSMEFLKDDKVDFQTYVTQAQLIQRMISQVNQKSYIHSIRLVQADGQTLEAGRGKRFGEDMKDNLHIADEANGKNIWITSRDGQYLIAAREIRQMESLTLDHLGYLLITIHMNTFIEESLNYLSDSNFIIKNNDEFIYTGEFIKGALKNLPDSMEGTSYSIVELAGKEYFVTRQDSNFSAIDYYNLRPFESVASTRVFITQVMIAYFIFILLLTIFVSRRSASAISKPIERLTSKTKQVQQGEFDQVKYEEEYLKDEIGDLQHNFHIMLDKINELINENYAKQLLIKETEYKALQSQINPHFLYNTLDSINWLAKINGQQKVARMVVALGNMLRNIISKKTPLVTIEEELEIIQDYITIQKHRYGDRLSFHLDADEKAKKAMIPKLTLQPLVENSIQHGQEEMTTACTIFVRITVKDEEIHMSVLDNGPGMDETTIQEIYKGNIQPKGSGIGLFNINERIKLMFGEKYHVEIHSKKEKGTRIRIILPFKKG